MSNVLTINSGSSSVKVSLYRAGEREERVFSGQLDRIGQDNGRFVIRDAARQTLVDQTLPLPDHDRAFLVLFDWLKAQAHLGAVGAVGHRIVHGGPRYREHQRVRPELLAEVRRLIPFDPLHLPSEIAAIEAVARQFPEVVQVACFDTVFHSTLPEVARIYPLPRHLADEGIQRYGFHGLSYEFIREELARRSNTPVASGKVIVAHLGSGASMAALREGVCVDTTMGFTPTGGLVMASRCGDLDPGVLLYLLDEKHLTVAQVQHLVNHEAGLLGLSGISGDMRDLEARPDEAAARLAIDVFCHQARKFIAAMAASLGGLDTLVFTAGIGENSPIVRQRISEGLDFLGIRLDPAKNQANADTISDAQARVAVRVIPTNEEAMIARHTARLVPAG